MASLVFCSALPAGAGEVATPDPEEFFSTIRAQQDRPLTVLPSSPDATPKTPAPLARLQALEADAGYANPDEPNPSNDVRYQLLRTEGRAIGAQHALYWRTKSLQSQFQAFRTYYDQIYNDAIRAVLIRFRDYYIVPPVISGTEGGMRKNDTGRVLRIAEQTYRIERDPYLVVNPPTWRDYLLYPIPKPQMPHSALLPATAEERAVWSEAVADGWRAGLRQADTNMRIHLARMTRDIVGMIRYHMLRLRNMVSAPQVDVKYMPISGGGRMMSLQDTVIRITSNPALNANRDSWKPLPQLPDTRWLFPADYLAYRGVAQ